MKRKVVPNIVRGGVAIPVKNNIFLLKGRTHEQGGIDIGRTLEAENNELIQMNKKDVKIFSSLPFLNGKSPAQRVMSGENPNAVFNAQERFKKRNKINDDGTKKKARRGGLYTLSVNGKQRLRPYPSTGEIELSKRQELTETAVMRNGGRKRKALGGDDDYNPWDYDYYRLHRITSDPFVAGAFIGANVELIGNKKSNSNTTKPATKSTTTKSVNNTAPTNKAQTSARTQVPINTGTATNARRTTKRSNTVRRTASRTNTNLTATPTNKRVNTNIISSDINIADTSMNIKPIEPAKITIPSLIDILPKVIDIKNTPIDYTPVPLESPNLTFRNRFRQYLRDNPETISDAVGLVSNLGSSLIGMGLTNHALNKMKYSSEPIPMRAAKLKTRININPQLDRMRESLASYERNIDANTGSSQVALARKQRARLADVLGRNELYADKENKETELINTDRINQQEVTNKNIEAYNNWVAGKAAFENSITEQKANNRIAAINNINAGVQQIVGNIQQRMADQRTLTALTLGSPNLPAEMFYGSGIWNKRMYDLYRRSYPLKHK